MHADVNDEFIYSVARRCVIKAAMEVISEEVRGYAEAELRRPEDDLLTDGFILPETAQELNEAMMHKLFRLNSLRRAVLVLRLFLVPRQIPPK